MPTNEESAKKLTDSCLTKSAGKWEKLKYRVIDAKKMRKFIEIITVYGNSLQCRQESVDDIERVLIEFQSFAAFKATEPDITRYGMARGFTYLFASLTIGNISISASACPKVYVKTDLEKRTSTVVSPDDLAYLSSDIVDE